MKWPKMYWWLLLWLAALAVPAFMLWLWGTTKPPDSWVVLSDAVLPALALASALLGFALGRQRRWRTMWIATALGALVLQVGDDVAYNNGWTVGGDPGVNLLLYFAVLMCIVGGGALLGAFTSGARLRLPKGGGLTLR